VEEVFKQLKCTKEGLTSAEGERRLQIFGYNKLEEKKVMRNSVHVFFNLLLAINLISV